MMDQAAGMLAKADWPDTVDGFALFVFLLDRKIKKGPVADDEALEGQRA